MRFETVAEPGVGEVVEGGVRVEAGGVGDVVPVGEVFAGPCDVFVVTGGGEEDAGGGGRGGWGVEGWDQFDGVVGVGIGGVIGAYKCVLVVGVIVASPARYCLC